MPHSTGPGAVPGDSRPGGLDDLRKFQLVVEHTSNMVVVTTADGEVEWVNQAYTDVTGWTLDEVHGRKPGSYLRGPGTDRKVVARLSELLARGEPVRGIELLNYTKQGREFWVSLNIQPVRDADGRVHHFVAIESDVTERKRYEQALLEQRRLLEQALQLAQMGSWEMDHATGRVTWSDGLYALFGMRRGSFGCDYEEFLSLVHPDDRGAVDAAFRHSLRTRQPYEAEHRVVWPDGQVRWMLERGVTSHAGDGRPLRSSGFTQDITDRKRAQQLEGEKRQLEAMSHAKTQFLSHMSHELRTPLNAIVGFSQLLQEQAGASLPEEVRRYPELILQASDHLLQLINDLLDLSLVESGGLALTRQAVDLDALIEEAVQLVAPIARAHGVDVTVLHTPGRVAAWGDRTRLLQCVLNVLSNGIKYNRRRGALLVRRHPVAGAQVRIDFVDEGGGVTGDRLERIFEPLNRLGAEHGDVPGTGLGLSLTRSLLQRMDGRIEVSSTPGEGSTFSIELQAAPLEGSAGKTEQPGPTMPGSPVGQGKVLCIEDNDVNRLLLQSMFSLRPDLSVRYAVTGDEGVRMAREQRPDLVVLDMLLPDTTGQAVFAALQADPLTRDVPVIGCSASAYAEDIRSALAQGLVAYLVKPLDVQQFLATLDRHLSPGSGDA